MKRSRGKAALVLAAALLGVGLMSQAQDQAYPKEKLEQMVAPIALYPDSLLSQLMMATTYPLQVVEADRWVQANKSVQGKALDDALAQQTWDPSVISLCKFPDVLNKMALNLDWTQDMGNAFLAQQGDVLDAVQAMRKKAYDSGNLKTSTETTVVVEQQVITVVPANPQVVYVPAYNPTVVYGGWGYPSYYYPAMMVPPPGYALARGIMWGAGFAIGNAMFGGCDWHGHSVYVNHNSFNNNNIYRNSNVNINRNVNVNVNQNQNWSHNAANRGNVPYKNSQLNQKYGQQGAGRAGGAQARGYDRPQGGVGGQGRPAAGRAQGQAGAAARQNQGARQNSFAGGGSGKSERQASSRGAQSRGGSGKPSAKPAGGAKAGGRRR